MNAELLLLIGSAASIAFIHTLMGPDHYLPFVAMAKARSWSLGKTLRITLWCGLGHLIGSIALGLIGIFLGGQLATLEWVEAIRGETAAWLLIGFGLAYMAWGLRQAWRKRRHDHGHWHGKQWHQHVHQHQREHAHVHDAATVQPAAKSVESTPQKSLTPWIIFIIFVLGPCEPLIPLLMYPAATHSVTGVIAVTTVFGTVTVLTMLIAVWVSSVGISQLRFNKLQRFDHALAGFAIFACGLGITFLGI
jgi:ABC-type nickel/cobalt efflux system permease component RcnA